jgi:hypothetical protein
MNMRKNKVEPTAEDTKLLVATASQDSRVAESAMRELAKSVELPLRQGILNGDITGDIWEPIPVTTNGSSRH